MTKTQEEVQALLDELEAEFDCHTESEVWENRMIGRMDALQDILDPERKPYTISNLRETIQNYLGYLMQMLWYLEDDE